ncbi:MAG: RNA methyltransferase [Hyphomicrobiales bacterium]|nr:RNA methyltransferase [Hyphomicrobiales bacterium]
MNRERKSIGQIKQITSPSNTIIKNIKGLQLKKNRDAEGLFACEGLKLVINAIDNGWNMKTLIYAHNLTDQPHFLNIAAKARTNGTDLLEVSEKVLGSLTRRDNPQLVVGVFFQKCTELSSIKLGTNDFWIGLDRVRDPGNLGTIIRTADCVGAKGVLLIGDSTDPWSLEAVRATMGSIFNIEIVRCGQSEFIKWRVEWDGLVIGTHLKGAVDYRSIDYHNKPVLVLMGNEQNGLPEDLVSLCTDNVLIPMAGKADSLNLAIATGIIAFEARRTYLKMPKNISVN